jgi:DNA-binding MarR family transcriptional regulator
MRQPYYSVESLEANSSVGYLVKRCGVLMTQVAEERFASLPISFTQWVVLMRLMRQDHISATRLSAEIGHDMGALTRVVDELEHAGFARRERSHRDRRAVEIAITAAGRRAVQKGKGAVVELLNRLIQPFTDHEIDTLLALLTRLHGHLEAALAPKGGVQPAIAPAAAARRRRPRNKPAARTSQGGAA